MFYNAAFCSLLERDRAVFLQLSDSRNKNLSDNNANFEWGWITGGWCTGVGFVGRERDANVLSAVDSCRGSSCLTADAISLMGCKVFTGLESIEVLRW